MLVNGDALWYSIPDRVEPADRAQELLERAWCLEACETACLLTAPPAPEQYRDRWTRLYPPRDGSRSPRGAWTEDAVEARAAEIT
jgi:hypothetical protein